MKRKASKLNENSGVKKKNAAQPSFSYVLNDFDEYCDNALLSYDPKELVSTKMKNKDDIIYYMDFVSHRPDQAIENPHNSSRNRAGSLSKKGRKSFDHEASVRASPSVNRSSYSRLNLNDLKIAYLRTQQSSSYLIKDAFTNRSEKPCKRKSNFSSRSHSSTSSPFVDKYQKTGCDSDHASTPSLQIDVGNSNIENEKMISSPKENLSISSIQSSQSLHIWKPSGSPLLGRSNGIKRPSSDSLGSFNIDNGAGPWIPTGKEIEISVQSNIEIEKMIVIEDDEDTLLDFNSSQPLSSNEWMKDWNTSSLEIKKVREESNLIGGLYEVSPSKKTARYLTTPKRQRTVESKNEKGNGLLNISKWRELVSSESGSPKDSKWSPSRGKGANTFTQSQAKVSTFMNIGQLEKVLLDDSTLKNNIASGRSLSSFLPPIDPKSRILGSPLQKSHEMDKISASPTMNNSKRDQENISNVYQDQIEGTFPDFVNPIDEMNEEIETNRLGASKYGSEAISSSSEKKRIKLLEKTFKVDEYKELLRKGLVTYNSNGVLEHYNRLKIKRKKLKVQQPYISRYEWKTKLHNEYAQFHLFADSIPLHFPKNENWKMIYQKAKQNDLSLFSFLFLSPKTPCSAASLLGHISKIVEFDRYVGFLDPNTQLSRSTFLNQNGTLRKNTIPPHSQYLIRFLKACQDKQTTLLMNNMPFSEVSDILENDIGEKNINYRIDTEENINVFAWMHSKVQHKLYILVSPTLTLYLPCFFNDQNGRGFDFKFSWVLTNNHLLNLGYGRIMGAVGLLGRGAQSVGVEEDVVWEKNTEAKPSEISTSKMKEKATFNI